MKIAILGSMSNIDKMVQIGNELKELGYESEVPEFRLDPAKLQADGSNPLVASNDMMRKNYEFVTGSDAVLVVNLPKDGVEDYIGPNTLIQMAFAYIAGKPIYLYSKIPESMSYIDEIRSLRPVELNQDLSQIQGSRKNT